MASKTKSKLRSYVHRETFKRTILGGYGGFVIKEVETVEQHYITLFNKTSFLAIHEN